MARVAIVGVGAIGGVLASLLHLSGRHQITLCTRRPLGQLTVRTPNGDVQVAATNLTDDVLASPVDWVLVATKTYDTEGAEHWVQPLASTGASIAIIQNGVEHGERIAHLIPQHRTLPVIIDCPVERHPDGLVVQRGDVKMTVESGSLGADFAALFASDTAFSDLAREFFPRARATNLEMGFRHSNVTIDLTDDFLTAAWRKLCFNSAGAISALTLRPAGVLRDSEMARTAADIVDECAAVARASGANIAPSIAEDVIAGYRAQPFDSINSMLADRLASRPMEIDARNGVIVRKGESLGIPTPLNRLLVALLRAATHNPSPNASA
jgi:2-dehydropantoate 2-reductase